MNRLRCLQHCDSSLDAAPDHLLVKLVDALEHQVLIRPVLTSHEVLHLESSIVRFEVHPNVLNSRQIRSVRNVEEECYTQICSCLSDADGFMGPSIVGEDR